MTIYEKQLAPRCYCYTDATFSIFLISIGLTHPNARKLFHSKYPEIRHKEYIFVR